MEKFLKEIKSDLKNIAQNGAFIFDIDNTLVSPDASFEHYPELISCLRKMIAKKIRLAFISGSPGAVVQNRLVSVLPDLNIETDSLTIYANGGSAKFLITSDGDFHQDKTYQTANRIPLSCLKEAQLSLSRGVVSGFDLESFTYEKVKDVWFRRRMEQWGALSIEFDDKWMRGEDWTICFLDDLKMAKVKASKGSTQTTFPFINVRQVEYDQNGQIEFCTSFSPTGFYTLSEKLNDGINLDLRDKIIENLKKDLTQWGDKLSFYKAGRSTIDITHKNVSKASALEDFIVTQQLKAEKSYYFGDEFFEGGNDAVFLKEDFLTKNPIGLIAVNTKEPLSKQLHWIGSGPKATLAFLEKITE